MFKSKGLLLILFLSPAFLFGKGEGLNLLDSVYQYRFIDSEKMTVFLEEAYQQNLKADDSYTWGRYYYEKGYNFILVNQPDSALSDFERSADYLLQYRDSLLYLKVNHSIANALFAKGEYNLSLSKYLETLYYIRGDLKQELRQFDDFKRIEGYCLKNIGVVEYVVFAEQKAIEYYKQSAVIFEEINDFRLLKYAYMSIAGCYLEQNDLKQCNLYLSKAKTIPDQYSDEVELGDFLLTYGYYHLKSDNIDSAQFYFKQCESIYTKYEDDFGIAVITMYLAEIESKLGNYSNAYQLLNSAYNYLKENDESRILLKAQLLMADVSRKLNKHQEAYDILKEAMETQKEILKNAELFFSYEIENKVKFNQDQYNDSLKTISNEFMIERYKVELTEKSRYNIFLWIAVVFFVILTPFLTMILARNKRINKALNESLNEKQVLFQEVHHRVKNNFQIISSLMNLQMLNSNDKKLDGLLKETQQRIMSMSFVHELLYKSNKFNEINMRNYIDELVPSIINSVSSSEVNIQFKVDTNQILLNLNQAIPIGLILNETITNSVKYAFVGRKEGTIEVEMTDSGNTGIVLKIKDNGVGIDTEKALSKKSLGLELIEVLVEQLDGEKVIRSSDKGTEFEIRF